MNRILTGRCLRSHARAATRSLATILASLALASPIASHAQAGNPAPSGRPLKVVIPFAAGTGVDVAGRIVAPGLAELLGRPVIVDNKPGAAGLIASREVAKSNAPQDTILLTTQNTWSINPHLYANLGYAEKDLDPVAMFGVASYMLVASPGSKLRTVNDLIAQGKSQPDTIRYGTYGVGSGSHLCMIMLEQATGIKAVHVPYKGSPLTDLVAGQIDLSLEPVAPALPFVDSGKITALGYTTSVKPGPARPAIGSVSDTVKGFECGTWIAFFAPAAAGKEFGDKFHAALQRVVSQPDIQAKLNDFAVKPTSMTRAEFRSFVAKDAADLGKVIRSANVKVE